ncbi:RAD51-associated protein 1 [Osmerus eperlanus]|uniref:RAD51-associated protein 1 n=1 Tax=Osmerus eperlanus TaxID=29151 RepID=UPI002E121001
MERPSRKTKVVNYSVVDQDFDDDEDFAFVKAPPSKKARDCMKDLEQEKPNKSSSKSSSQESDAQSLGCKPRVPVDEKLYNRDLEAALTLSLLQNSDLTEKHCSTNQDVKNQPQTDYENTDPALHLTNCSVDINVLGLDKITSEQGSLCGLSRQRKSACTATEKQRSMLKDEDEDYQPKVTIDAESDDDFSDQAKSEDEEFSLKKAKKTNKKEKIPKKERRKPPLVSRKGTLATTKPSIVKPHLTTNPTMVKSQTAAKPAPVSRHPSTPPLSRSTGSVSPTPAGGRIPKWNPPAQIGGSPGASQNASGKSPGQGLRLGLSRRMRVKPLHPSVAIH